MNASEWIKDIQSNPDWTTTEIDWEAVDEIGEKLKAFGIIKKKKVSLEYLKCCKTYEQYKNICSYWDEITPREFDLLKEVME